MNWNRTKGGNLYYPEFNSPETNNGVARGLDFENFGAAMVTLTYGPLKVWGRTQSRQKGIPTASYGTTFNNLESTTNRSSIFGADYTKGFGSNKQFDLRTYSLRTSATGVYPYGGDTGAERSGGLRYGAEGRFRWDLKVNQRLIFGSELSRAPIAEYSYAVGGYGIAFKRPFSLASVYVQHEYQPFSRVSIVTGIRHDKYSHARGSTNPRLAVIVTPTARTTFKVLYGSSFRIPSMYELDYEDPVFGAKKNLALRPERIRSLEAVVEHRLTRETFVVLSAYKLEASRLIDPVIDPADALIQFQNVGAANGQGLEVELNMRRKEGLWAYGSYSYQQVTAGGRWMTNSPHHLFKAGVSTNPWARLHGGLEVAHESERRTVQNTTTNAATLAHGTGSAQIARDTRLILTVRNLFGVKYANPVGPEFTQAAIPQDGRTFTLSLSYRP